MYACGPQCYVVIIWLSFLALLSLGTIKSFVLEKNQSLHFLCWIIFLALWRVEGMKKCRDSFTIIFTFHICHLCLFSVLLLLPLLQLSFRFWSHLSPHALRINTCLVKIIMTSFILQLTDIYLFYFAPKFRSLSVS